MPQLKVSERQAGAVTIVDVSGKITFAEGGGSVHESVRRLIDQGKKHILLNLVDASHIDSSGIGALVSSYTTTVQSGGHLKLLLSPTGMIHDVLARTKMLSVLQAYDDEGKAVGSFGPTGH